MLPIIKPQVRRPRTLSLRLNLGVVCTARFGRTKQYSWRSGIKRGA